MLFVEIADSYDTQSKGLMHRRHLPEDSGMLFIFNDKRDLTFWGRNTYLPLDIAFVDDDNKIIKISKIDPLCEKVVHSGKECKIAIEANVGYFDSKNIKVGDTIIIDKKNSNGIVRFDKN